MIFCFLARLRRVMWGALLCVASLSAQAGGKLLVVYPDVGEPFRDVFEQITQGIESRATVWRLKLRDGDDHGVLTRAVAERRPDAIVALGQRTVKTVTALGFSVPVVAGAILSLPEQGNGKAPVAGISLAPDPALLFARLRALAPQARQVSVVYNPAQNEWLIRLAREAAPAHGLELVAYPVSGVKEAVIRYRDIFSRIQGTQHAVWMLMDGYAAEESTVLPLVLEQAWQQQVVLFASNLGHVQRGALFCLFPDHRRLGSRLGEMSGTQHAVGLAPLQDVRFAVNRRTASHLRIEIGRESAIDLVFPAP